MVAPRVGAITVEPAGAPVTPCGAVMPREVVVEVVLVVVSVDVEVPVSVAGTPNKPGATGIVTAGMTTTPDCGVVAGGTAITVGGAVTRGGTT